MSPQDLHISESHIASAHLHDDGYLLNGLHCGCVWEQYRAVIYRDWMGERIGKYGGPGPERDFILDPRRRPSAPTEKNGIESSEILARIRDHRGFPPAKLRDLHFDVLIARTARSHGARLITTKETDFNLIKSYREFKLEVW